MAETRALGANRGGGEVVLLALMAVQLLVDPDSSYAGLMPLWSTCELTGYALDAPTANSLSNGLGHFAVTVVLCSLAAWGFGILRLRTRKFGPTPGIPGDIVAVNRPWRDRRLIDGPRTGAEAKCGG